MRQITALFFLVMFVIGTDTFLISPLIPILQSLFDVPTRMAGWMVGAYTLGSAVFALITGPLSDGWDRKQPESDHPRHDLQSGHLHHECGDDVRRLDSRDAVCGLWRVCRVCLAGSLLAFLSSGVLSAEKAESGASRAH